MLEQRICIIAGAVFLIGAIMADSDFIKYIDLAIANIYFAAVFVIGAVHNG